VDAPLRVQVVYALPERCWTFAIELAAGACVADALAAADLASNLPGVEVDPARLGVFGHTATLRTPLHDGDRVEILRPLRADPKQARRERARDAAKR
jgi:putative ubiquitin-RnfH superfamily antitoxin RatB of RatAB toxin-antitoxin module